MTDASDKSDKGLAIAVGFVILIVAGMWVESNALKVPVEIWSKLIDLVGRATWPAAALLAAFWFRPEIRQMATRIQSVYGVQLAQQTAASVDGAILEGADRPSTDSRPALVTGPPRESGQSASPTKLPVDLGAPPTVAQDLGGTELIGDAHEISYFRRSPYAVGHATLDATIRWLTTTNLHLGDESREASERQLVYALAEATVLADFREISIVIYGSQYRLLRLLEQREQLSGIEVENQWKAARNTSVQRDTPIIWISWIVERQLVDRAPDESVRLTARGRDFMNWVARTAKDLSLRPG